LLGATTSYNHFVPLPENINYGYGLDSMKVKIYEYIYFVLHTQLKVEKKND